jgi:chemotaxis protein MotB
MRAGPEGEDEENDPRRVRVAPEARGTHVARADAPPGDQDPRERRAEGSGETSDARHLSDAELRAEHERRERAAFERAAAEIRRMVEADPALADLGRQLLIEQAPEGLRIQLLDAERQPMFALGGAAPNDRARQLIARVAQVAARLPNPVAITGHTDATPFRGGGERSNWDLSSERANATRRLLAEAGLPDARIQSVSGQAERQPLLPDQPTAAANRRVAITLLRVAREARGTIAPEVRGTGAPPTPRQEAATPRAGTATP